MENGTLVSKAIRDSLWQRTDTLATFRKAVAVINLVDYLQQKRSVSTDYHWIAQTYTPLKERWNRQLEYIDRRHDKYTRYNNRYFANY